MEGPPGRDLGSLAPSATLRSSRSCRDRTGLLLGEVSFFGLRLGVAGVLFVGLAVGSLSPAITLPEVIATLGLVLFVYAMGLARGGRFSTRFGDRALAPALAAGP